MVIDHEGLQYLCLIYCLVPTIGVGRVFEEMRCPWFVLCGKGDS